MDILKELNGICKILASTQLMDTVRAEVKQTLGKKAMVIGGQFAGEHSKQASEYEVVVVAKSGDKAVKLMARRMKANIPNLEVTKLDSLVGNVIGIRRGKM